MKPLSLVVACASLAALNLQAKTVLVNTTNNVSPGPGETNLVQAINLLEDGDTIRFDIPGPGPFYLVTPPLTPDNGYPAITNNNVTIDGFSQPGAAPNTNPILGANNARLQIVLDSRAGGMHIQETDGCYSDHEAAVLFISGATNVNIRGLCFLGPGTGDLNNPTPGAPNTYAISFASGASYGHISGCQIGLDLDGQSVYRFFSGITGFECDPSLYIEGTTVGVGLDATNAAAARAEFNIIIGEYIPVVLEGSGYRIAGNFFNVFPNGLTDFNINGNDPYNMQAFIEIGQAGNNVVIGTDGDGLNDAEERNIFGGVTVDDDDRLLEWYNGQRTNQVIAGNYFGVGVDGITRFTNSMKIFNGFNSSTTVRIGSDFDGVSDDVEGNVICMNYPFETLFPNPPSEQPPIFAQLDAGARVSLRGNRLIGNNIPPFSYADGYGGALDDFTNYYAPYVDTNEPITPALFTNSTQGRIKGDCALGVAPYTNIFIDVYLADPEGWTNGQQFEFEELKYTDPFSGQPMYYGFVQGRTFLASFLDNGPLDLNQTPGQFEFDISSLGLPTNVLVTVTANYSADPPGTHNGRVQTSVFAMPITLQPAPTLNFSESGHNLVLSWPTNQGVFTIQFSATLAPLVWNNLTPQPPITISGENYQAILPPNVSRAFYRLAR